MLDFLKDLAYVGSCGLIDFDESSETSYTVRRKQKFDTENFVSVYFPNIRAIMIRNEFGNDSIPVNPVSIILGCGLKTVYDTKNWIDHENKTIFVDEKLSLEEQRVYLAEALGKYLIRNRMKNPPSPDSEEENINARKFARELLLPQSIFIEICSREKQINIPKCSKFFGVTENFFSKRITEIDKRDNANLLKIFDAIENIS